jgi:hypothetical protein
MYHHATLYYIYQETMELVTNNFKHFLIFKEHELHTR